MANKPKTPTIVKEQPVAAATISKLTTDREIINKGIINIPEVAMSNKDRIANNENITQLFTDVELCIQILTASILSPNDMLTTNIIYTAPDIKIPVEIKSYMVETIKKHIKTNYNLEDKLSTILREALFTKGAYIEAVIPEASLDEMINNDGQVSLENLDKRLNDLNAFNFLGNENVSVVISTEDFSIQDGYRINNRANVTITTEDVGIDITDNFNVLYKSTILKTTLKNNTRNKLRKTNLTTEETKHDLNSLFKDANSMREQPFIMANNNQDTYRSSVGKPLVMKLPTESVIPVHVDNDPSKHLGYFVLLDEAGLPIDSNSDIAMGVTDMNNLINKNDSGLNIITKAKDALYGIVKKDVKLNNLEHIYSDIVENMLRKKLNTGDYAGLVSIKENADVYRVMLIRALKAKRTRILFLPAELVTYYAFEYRENGTGKSLLEKVGMLFSIRSILLFSSIMATVKNSVTTTDIEAILDEHDPEPQKSMEKIISESLRTRQTQLPLGVTKIEDLVDWSYKVGFRYNFKHPGLPDMNISVSDNTTSKSTPDSELSEKIEEMIIMSFGLTPEMVKAGYNEDFATTAIAKNLLLAKRVTQTQNILNPIITDNIQKYIINDTLLRNKLSNIILDNKTKIIAGIKKQDEREITIDLNKIQDDDLVNYIISIFEEELTAGLPKPEVSETSSMADSFKKYKDALDEYLELIMSDEALPEDVLGELSGKLNGVKSVMKTVLIKKWMADNGYMPEISEFMTMDSDGKPVFDILAEYSEYAENISKVILPFLKNNSRFITKTDDKINELDDDADDDADDGDGAATETEDKEKTDGRDEDEDTGDTAAGDGDSADDSVF